MDPHRIVRTGALGARRPRDRACPDRRESPGSSGPGRSHGFGVCAGGAGAFVGYAGGVGCAGWCGWFASVGDVAGGWWGGAGVGDGGGGGCGGGGAEGGWVGGGWGGGGGFVVGF